MAVGILQKYRKDAVVGLNSCARDAPATGIGIVEDLCVGNFVCERAFAEIGFPNPKPSTVHGGRNVVHAERSVKHVRDIFHGDAAVTVVISVIARFEKPAASAAVSIVTNFDSPKIVAVSVDADGTTADSATRKKIVGNRLMGRLARPDNAINTRAVVPER